MWSQQNPERSPLENIEDVPIEEVDEAAESANEVASDDKIGDENEEPSRSMIVEEENESDEEDEQEQEEIDEDSLNGQNNHSL